MTDALERDSDGDSEGDGGADDAPPREALLRDAAALAAYLTARLRDAPPTELRARPPISTRVAAVLVPIFARDGAPHLLFTQRTATLSRHSGEISFPGGARDRGDASLAATALRETHEELALDPSAVAVLGPLPPVLASVSGYAVAPYVGWLGGGLPPLRPNPAEVAEVFEAPLAALADPAIFHEEQWRRGGVEHTVYFYDFGRYRIWGLTGRILSTLLALLPPA